MRKLVLVLLLTATPAFGAQLCVTVPDALQARVVDGVSGQYGYSATLPNGSSNPETKIQFVKRMLRTWVKNSVVAYEARTAGDAARKTAKDAAETEISVQ